MRSARTTPAVGQLAVDLGDAAVLGIAEPADQGHDVETELVIGQGEVGLGLGAVGSEEAGTSGIGTASDRQGQPDDAVEGGDGAEVVVVGLEPVLAFGAVEGDRSQGQGAIGLRAWRPTHAKPPGSVFYPLSTFPSPAKFASLEKKKKTTITAESFDKQVAHKMGGFFDDVFLPKLKKLVDAGLSYDEVKRLVKIPSTWGAKISGEQFKERVKAYFSK